MKRHYIKHTLKFTFLLLTFLFANSSSLFAQSSDDIIRCVSVEYEQSRLDEKYEQYFDRFEEYIEAQRNKLGSESVNNYTIPVVFHIIHDNDAVGSGDNIARQYIDAQLEQLNNDFRKITGTSGDGGGVDTGIEFCMATIDEGGNALSVPGINRIDRNTKGWSSPPYGTPILGCFAGANFDYVNNTIKPESQWNPDEYLNIWVLDMVCGILGYAQFPEASTLPGIGTGNGGASSDGVVVLPSSVGSTDVPQPGAAPFDAGRTLTHEIGHFFGLRHIWGDGDCNADDFCADTPTASNSTSGCPSGKDSCPGGGNDQIENYMDYSDDDCMERFTADQTDRMQIVMGATGVGSPRRAILASSPACGGGSNPSFSINATNSPVTVTQPADATFNFNVSFNGGFSSSVTLSTSGLPSGLNASFSTNPVTSAGSYSMTVSGTGNVAAGTYNFNIDGNGGGLSDSEAVTLVVEEENTGGGDCNTFTSNTTVNIPDQTTVTSTINVGTNGTISDVNVAFNGEHDAVRDLTFELISPSGTTIQIVDLDDPCNRQDDFDLGFDDQATQTISNIPCPPTTGDSYQPEQALSAFNGQSSGGTWTLRITDDRRRFEGALQGWSIEICTGNVTPPTCTDGIQNGNETGVDCGGPDCDPCTTDPTCDDGIQNGLETGVDCGGPDCDPCTTDPTCDDGIQNGLETGVDCGGPDCDPCNTGGDCDAPTGLVATAISKKRATLNWNAVADANDYDVQYREAGTSAWTDRNTSDTDIRITGLRNRRTYEWRVRANCNAGTSDWSVTCEFTAGTSSSGGCGAGMIGGQGHTNGFTQATLTAYPNPASNELNVRLNLASEGNLRLIDITGRTVFEAVVRYGASTQEINVSNLPKGLYFLELRSEGEVQVEKIVVE